MTFTGVRIETVPEPTVADLENKKTFLEDNAQFPRKLVIA